jgi:hypothetical protein
MAVSIWVGMLLSAMFCTPIVFLSARSFQASFALLENHPAMGADKFFGDTVECYMGVRGLYPLRQARRRGPELQRSFGEQYIKPH